MVRFHKLGAAVFPLNANPRSGPDTNVPDELTVAGSFALQILGAGAGHVGHHKMTSISCAIPSGLWVCVDDGERLILIVPSGMTSTQPAPACFAARIALATSACVMRAGVRLILPLRS